MPHFSLSFRLAIWSLAAFVCTLIVPIEAIAQQPRSSALIVLHAARLLEVDTGAVLQPGEILIEGERIRAVGKSVEHPQGAKVIDLGDTTLLPGLIDAHIHLFLHPGAEDLQTENSN
jgi:imidazolonepropionase-like amidohydrolase